MVEGAGGAVGLLTRAVGLALQERPVDLPPSLALERCAELLVVRERIGAVVSRAVSDVATRELFALDAAGSARGWLRRQVSGEDGLLTRARQLDDREGVWLALATGELSSRAAGQVCTSLDKVPAEVDEDVLVGVLVDGLQDVLGRQLGRGLPSGRQPSPDQLALRAELASTVGDALNDISSTPDVRLEPVLLLVARHVSPGALAHQLDYLLDALLPDRIGAPDPARYFVDLVPALDGDWDLRGHLDHQTGLALQAELARQESARKKALDAAKQQAEAERAARAEAQRADEAEQAARAEAARANAAARAGAQRAEDGRAAAPAVPGVPAAASAPAAPLDEPTAADVLDDDPFVGLPRAFPAKDDRLTKGRLRHDALLQALLDVADHTAGSGQPTPVSMTVIATIDAVEGKPGAPPGLLLTGGRPVSLSSRDLQRMGCNRELTAVLLDAAGRPVGVSSTRRLADKRERAALTALWGPWCAIAGCARTRTVPHHVLPWATSRETVLRDLLPLCDSCHHDLHLGHRTLLLKDHRRIDDHGWA